MTGGPASSFPAKPLVVPPHLAVLSHYFLLNIVPSDL
jgi:hypothetical protein